MADIGRSDFNEDLFSTCDCHIFIANMTGKLVDLIVVFLSSRSLSYILLMAGFAYFFFAGFYLIIDVFPIWNGAPFKYPGVLLELDAKIRLQ